MVDGPWESENREFALEVGSGLANAAVGSLVAGPAGGAVGAVAGPALKKAVQLLAARLGGRGEDRAKTAVGHAAVIIGNRQERGDEPRSDGFFAEDQFDRSAADEVAEASLRAAAEDPEEQKLPFYGALLANICFRPDISRGTANQLIRDAHHLTYRQCVILALANEALVRPPYFGVEMERGGWLDLPLDVDRESVRRDFEELERMRLITSAPNRHNDRVPSPPGRDLIDLMQLEKIPQDDLVVLRPLIESGNEGPWTQAATYPDGLP